MWELVKNANPTSYTLGMEPRTSHKWGKCSTYQDTHFNIHPMFSRVCKPCTVGSTGTPGLHTQAPSSQRDNGKKCPTHCHMTRAEGEDTALLPVDRFCPGSSGSFTFSIVFFFKIYFILHVCGICVCCTCVRDICM